MSRVLSTIFQIIRYLELFLTECTDSEAFRQWATGRTEYIKLPFVETRPQELIVDKLFDHPLPQVTPHAVQQAVDDLDEFSTVTNN